MCQYCLKIECQRKLPIFLEYYEPNCEGEWSDKLQLMISVSALFFILTVSIKKTKE